MVLANVGSATLVSLVFKAGWSGYAARVQPSGGPREGETRRSRISTTSSRTRTCGCRTSWRSRSTSRASCSPRRASTRPSGTWRSPARCSRPDEVGGDYYDTIHFGPSGIISIGDVTDHGLHSGLIMMMVHTALRALSSHVERNDIQRIFRVINKLLYDFRLKTKDHRIMSLVILKYLGDGEFVMTGQHESLLDHPHGRLGADIEALEYGMYAGLDANVSPYLRLLDFKLDEDGHADPVHRRRDRGRGRARTALSAARASSTPRSWSAPRRPRRSAPPSWIACQQHIGDGRRFDDISWWSSKAAAGRALGRGAARNGAARRQDRFRRGTCESAFTCASCRWTCSTTGSGAACCPTSRPSISPSRDFASERRYRPRFDRGQRARGECRQVLGQQLAAGRAHAQEGPGPAPGAGHQLDSAPPVRVLRRRLHGAFRAGPRRSVRRARVGENTEQREASGLGLLLVKKDYCSALSFEFRFDEDETVQVAVTAELDFA